MLDALGLNTDCKAVSLVPMSTAAFKAGLCGAAGFASCVTTVEVGVCDGAISCEINFARRSSASLFCGRITRSGACCGGVTVVTSRCGVMSRIASTCRGSSTLMAAVLEAPQPIALAACPHRAAAATTVAVAGAAAALLLPAVATRHYCCRRCCAAAAAAAVLSVLCETNFSSNTRVERRGDGARPTDGPTCCGRGSARVRGCVRVDGRWRRCMPRIHR